MPQSQRHIKYQYKIQTKCSVEKTHDVSKKCPKKCQQKCPKKWMWYLYFRMSQKWKYYNYGCMWMATISFVKTFSIDLLKRLFDIHVEKVLIIQYTTGKIRYRKDTGRHWGTDWLIWRILVWTEYFFLQKVFMVKFMISHQIEKMIKVEAAIQWWTDLLSSIRINQHQ